MGKFWENFGCENFKFGEILMNETFFQATAALISCFRPEFFFPGKHKPMVETWLSKRFRCNFALQICALLGTMQGSYARSHTTTRNPTSPLPMCERGEQCA